VGERRVYQQTAIDTYSKVGFAKLYDRKSALTAADLLNDRVIVRRGNRPTDGFRGPAHSSTTTTSASTGC